MSITPRKLTHSPLSLFCYLNIFQAARHLEAFLVTLNTFEVKEQNGLDV